MARKKVKPKPELNVRQLYDDLFQAYGPQHWWPGESREEVVIGAVLVQSVSWKNVEQAIDNLRNENLIHFRRLYELPLADLHKLIQPIGYYRVKAKRLRNLLEFLVVKHDGSLDSLFALPMEAAREQLLAVNGVGPETADSILLYAGQMPSFVVDAYTRRVLLRHGWIDPPAKYEAMQRLFENQLPAEAELFNEFHALIVRVGNQFCSRTPKCEECPLRHRLPRLGPLET